MLKKNKNLIYFLIIFSLALILRIRFTIITEEPFSTDSWPLIKNSQIIAERGKLSGEEIDPYNANWPSSQFFSAMIAGLLKLNILDFMRFSFPLFSSFTIAVYFLFLRRIIGEKASLVASLLLAFSGYNVFFGGGVTKETFALMFFYQILLVFVLNLKKPKFKAIYTLLFITLLLSHHFTLLNLLLVITFAALGISMHDIIKERNIRKDILLLPIFSFLLAFIYYQFYVSFKITYVVPYNEIINFIFYQLLLLFLFTKLKIINPESNNLRLGILFIILLMIGFILSIRFNFIYTNVFSSPFFLMFAASGFLLLVFVVLGYKRLEYFQRVLLFALSTPFLAFYTYLVLSANSLQTTMISTRLLNFILPLMFPFASIALIRFKKRISIPILAFMLSIFIVQNLAIHPLELNGTGYQWLYYKTEVLGIEWAHQYLSENYPMLADRKMSYLLSYFGLRGDVIKGYIILLNHGEDHQEFYFVFYNQMEKNGYVLAYEGEPIKDLKNKLNKFPKIFSNGDLEIFFG